MENLASPNVAVSNFDELAPTKAGSSDFTALMEKALAEGGAAPPGAEPPAAASTDESSQPLEKRVASTKAPVRKAAYAELSDAFASATDDAPFEAHGAALPKMLADSAPACHEAALQAAKGVLPDGGARKAGGGSGATTDDEKKKLEYRVEHLLRTLDDMERKGCGDGGAAPVADAPPAAVPVGHTAFSWAGGGSALPVGHTPFSWRADASVAPITQTISARTFILEDRRAKRAKPVPRSFQQLDIAVRVPVQRARAAKAGIAPLRAAQDIEHDGGRRIVPTASYHEHTNFLINTFHYETVSPDQQLIEHFC